MNSVLVLCKNDFQIAVSLLNIFCFQLSIGVFSVNLLNIKFMSEYDNSFLYMCRMVVITERSFTSLDFQRQLLFFNLFEFTLFEPCLFIYVGILLITSEGSQYSFDKKFSEFPHTFEELHYYRPQTKFGARRIFAPVCHSVHKGGGTWAGTPPWQVHPRAGHPPGQVHPLGYGQQAGGTHPTGMHSCFFHIRYLRFSRHFFWDFPLIYFFRFLRHVYHIIYFYISY